MFLFRFGGNELPLIDRKLQAVALPEMVLAVDARVGEIPSDVRCAAGVPSPSHSRSCGDDVRFFGSDELTRPVLGAMLQTGWGLSPEFESWSQHVHEEQSDFLFGPLATPFGYLSSSGKLSYFHRDSARSMEMRALRPNVTLVRESRHQRSGRARRAAVAGDVVIHGVTAPAPRVSPPCHRR